MSNISSISSSSASVSSKVIPTKDSEPVTINEKVNLTKEQNEVLQMICNSYDLFMSKRSELANLYDFVSRSYFSELGRFIQRDTLPFSNLYTFVDNNPLTFVVIS